MSLRSYSLSLPNSRFIQPEQGHWDTSRALVRRTLERCIHLGRQQRSQGKKQDEYEAYRLLGTAVRSFLSFPPISTHHSLIKIVAYSRRLYCPLQLLRAHARADGVLGRVSARRRPGKGASTEWKMGSPDRDWLSFTFFFCHLPNESFGSCRDVWVE